MTNVLLADSIATSSPVNAPMDQDVADVQTFSFNFRGFSNVLELQHFIEGKCSSSALLVFGSPTVGILSKFPLWPLLAWIGISPCFK